MKEDNHKTEAVKSIMTNDSGVIVAIDVGEKRIGIAASNLNTRLPRPVMTLEQTPAIIDEIGLMLKEQAAVCVVIGLPRNLDGDDTAQTRYVREFGSRLQKLIPIPVYWVDEALTSKQAETELEERGRAYVKGDIDALAACYILTDFLNSSAEDLKNYEKI